MCDASNEELRIGHMIGAFYRPRTKHAVKNAFFEMHLLYKIIGLNIVSNSGYF